MEENFIIKDIDNKSGTTYLAEITKIQDSNQEAEIKLELLDKLIKDYLRKKYHIKRNTEYESMIEFFIGKNKPHLAAFCNEMVLALYSGDMATANNAAVMLQEAKAVIEKEEGLGSGVGITIKKVLSPLLSRFRKQEKTKISAMSDTKNVSKQTKREIDRELENTSKIKSQLNSDSIFEETKKDKTQLYKLNPALAPDYNTDNEDEEFRNIRSIDDLEQIKKKIKQRKIIYKKDDE